jgi:predicted O-methyltransferase YrrM
MARHMKRAEEKAPEATKINFALYKGCPFDGIHASSMPHDAQGWITDTHVLDQIIDQIRPTLIIEVGTWKGLSAFYLLRRALLYNNASIICVDTWLGSSEHWLSSQWKPLLAFRNGRPTLYEQFLANVVHEGLVDRIVPLPLPSRQAAEVLQQMRVQAQFIYIDGAHDERSVREDIAAYWPLVPPGGVLVGDDYHDEWPGVKAAVQAFWNERAEETMSKGTGSRKWFAQKRRGA